MLSMLTWRTSVVISLLLSTSFGAAFDVFAFVDPLIGARNGGMKYLLRQEHF